MCQKSTGIKHSADVLPYQEFYSEISLYCYNLKKKKKRNTHIRSTKIKSDDNKLSISIQIVSRRLLKAILSEMRKTF